MTAIWHNDGLKWKLLSPNAYPDEKTLHTLVANSVHILPLAGSPTTVIVGSEVLLGSGYADLIALEPSGRVVVIEVKLAKNAESRRAVVAQILTYAAYLKGVSAATFEQEVLKNHLAARGYATLAEAIRNNDQAGTFDAESFYEGLENSLAQGHFRLVLVSDRAPAELVRLVGTWKVLPKTW